MGARVQHAVTIRGSGSRTVLLAHGIGGTQRQWDGVVAELSRTTRTVPFDLASFGDYDMAAYAPGPHETLFGYANDLTQLCSDLELGGVVYVGHSLSGMAGLLASISGDYQLWANGFAQQVMQNPERPELATEFVADPLGL